MLLYKFVLGIRFKLRIASKQVWEQFLRIDGRFLNLKILTFETWILSDMQILSVDIHIHDNGSTKSKDSEVWTGQCYFGVTISLRYGKTYVGIGR